MIAWGDMDSGQGNDCLVNLSQGYESADNSSARGTDHRSATCVELKRPILKEVFLRSLRDYSRFPIGLHNLHRACLATSCYAIWFLMAMNSLTQVALGA